MDVDEEPAELRLRMHDPRVVDARERVLATGDLPEERLTGAVEVMDAVFRWRRAEQRVSEASQEYMRLSATDMRAVRFVIVQTDHGEVVSARDIAEHLGVTTASTTKLLDRLERGQHIVRRPHPTDRRALAIVVTESTRAAAEETIGREYARRFRVAAELDEGERAVVLKFLDAMSRTEEGSWPQG